MSFWNPESDRIWLLDRGVAFAHAQDYAQEHPVGGLAESHVKWLAMAHLVGLGETMLDLAPRAIDAIDHAISCGESTGLDPAAWHSLLTETKAIAQWLCARGNPKETWAQAFDLRLASFQRHEGRPMRVADKNLFVDDTMACGVQAERYADAITFHDAVCGHHRVSIKGIRSPRQLAYALCVRATSDTLIDDADNLVIAGHRVLRNHLAEQWLHNGQYLRAAKWLKVVHEFESPGLSPAQVMLKAYDDMPTIPMPAFLDRASR